MSACTSEGCACKTLYVDWLVGQRRGACEDCKHFKKLTTHAKLLLRCSSFYQD